MCIVLLSIQQKQSQVGYVHRCAMKQSVIIIIIIVVVVDMSSVFFNDAAIKYTEL